MIKNIIIIILIILLLISFYSYYCLSNSMIKYEDDKMNYINEKQLELDEREKKLGSITQCMNQNNSYQNAIDKIFNLSKSTTTKQITYTDMTKENKIEQELIEKKQEKMLEEQNNNNSKIENYKLKNSKVFPEKS